MFNPHFNIWREVPRKGYGLRNLFARNQFPTGRHRNWLAIRILVRIPVLERQGLPGLPTQRVNWRHNLPGLVINKGNPRGLWIGRVQNRHVVAICRQPTLIKGDPFGWYDRRRSAG